MALRAKNQSSHAVRRGLDKAYGRTVARAEREPLGARLFRLYGNHDLLWSDREKATKHLWDEAACAAWM